MPPGEFDAVLLTSAAAAQRAGKAADAVKGLPTLCVGEATARAAREVGFLRAVAAGGTVASAMAADGGRILHLAGEDRTPFVEPSGTFVTVCVVYTARLLPLADPGPVDAVMLYSLRSAVHFVDEWTRLGRARDITILTISEAAAAGVVTGDGEAWRKLVVARAPNEASMLAALADEGL